MPPGTEFELASNLVIAGLCGLAVGIEREWSGHASGPAARFAGARTFLLLGFLGGAAGWIYTSGAITLATVIVGGACALTVAAYVMAARRGGDAVEGTTEAAALAVVVLGLAAGMGHARLAAAIASVLVLALAEKSAIQGLIQRIGQKEMEAALRFAVLALVILPLLPEGPYGPLGGVSPRSLWAVVLLFSGLNFLGYIARRAVGEARGYGLTGLLGGLISSTAVTFTFSRQSRQRTDAGAFTGPRSPGGLHRPAASGHPDHGLTESAGGAGASPIRAAAPRGRSRDGAVPGSNHADRVRSSSRPLPAESTAAGGGDPDDHRLSGGVDGFELRAANLGECRRPHRGYVSWGSATSMRSPCP